MWDVAAGPFLAAAGLLVVAGVPKLSDPLPLVRALRQAGMPAGRLLVRAFALGEVAVGVWALLDPSRLSAALVAAAYLLFTAFVVRVLRRGGVLGSCGCFGKADTPATRTHVALTAAAALAAAVVAADPPASVWTSPAGGLATTTALAALAAVIAFLAWQVMAVLPTTTAAAVRTAFRTSDRTATSTATRG
jgi:hypothetical protein